MVDLISGAAVGSGLQELVKLAITTTEKCINFKPTLESNIETLNSLTPLIEKIKQHNNILDRPKEIEKLENEIKAGREIVNKCSKFRWWWRFMFFPKYHDELQSRNKKLLSYLSVEMQAQMASDIKETLCNVREILEILMKVIGGLGNHHGKLELSSWVPEKPEFIVGFNDVLNKLKFELLKEGPVSILSVTGLGGSGKSTLAKILCWDDQVKGKFGGKIYFVAVTRTPNWKTIVQILFERCGQSVPQFQSDDDAINQLGSLLKHVASDGSPILLVLDDVWPGSETEAIVQKCKFQISNYRILVTSRVAIPRFGKQYHLKPLDHDDSLSLFRHFARLDLEFPIAYMPDKDLVEEIVRGCKGLRLALEVIGGSLCNQPFVVWDNMKNQPIIDSNDDLFSHLQKSLDIFEGESSTKEKECFIDLGLFPQNQRICVPTLIDMWAVLYKLEEDGKEAMRIIHNLTNKNLVNVIVTRKVCMEKDLYYNNHFLTQHDLLRELAIHQSSQGPFEKRKRLVIDLTGNNHPEWWVEQNHEGIISYFSSFFPMLWKNHKPIKVLARTLSISTDETFNLDWCNILPNEVEILILNIRSSNYTLPKFTYNMRKLKALIVTNYSYHFSEVDKFELLSSLPYLKTIRLQKISIPILYKLENLQKLSIYMCKATHAFGTSSIKISDTLPNLVELNIEYCCDLLELPSDICKITTLKKLTITNCHNLSTLPQEIGNLENLIVLRLSSCSDLVELPESIVRLKELGCLDVSNCVKIEQLPENIGDLQCLEKFYLLGCSSLTELPKSVMKFRQLKHVMYVICNEEMAALWENLLSEISNVKIEISKEDNSLNWLHV